MANKKESAQERAQRLRRQRAQADSISMREMYGKNGTERRKAKKK